MDRPRRRTVVPPPAVTTHRRCNSTPPATSTTSSSHSHHRGGQAPPLTHQGKPFLFFEPSAMDESTAVSDVPVMAPTTKASPPTMDPHTTEHYPRWLIPVVQFQLLVDLGGVDDVDIAAFENARELGKFETREVATAPSVGSQIREECQHVTAPVRETCYVASLAVVVNLTNGRTLLRAVNELVEWKRKERPWRTFRELEESGADSTGDPHGGGSLASRMMLRRWNAVYSMLEDCFGLSIAPQGRRDALVAGDRYETLRLVHQLHLLVDPRKARPLSPPRTVYQPPLAELEDSDVDEKDLDGPTTTSPEVHLDSDSPEGSSQRYNPPVDPAVYTQRREELLEPMVHQIALQAVQLQQMQRTVEMQPWLILQQRQQQNMYLQQLKAQYEQQLHLQIAAQRHADGLSHHGGTATATSEVPTSSEQADVQTPTPSEAGVAAATNSGKKAAPAPTLHDTLSSREMLEDEATLRERVAVKEAAERLLLDLHPSYTVIERFKKTKTYEVAMQHTEEVRRQREKLLEERRRQRRKQEEEGGDGTESLLSDEEPLSGEERRKKRTENFWDASPKKKKEQAREETENDHPTQKDTKEGDGEAEEYDALAAQLPPPRAPSSESAIRAPDAAAGEDSHVEPDTSLPLPPAAAQPVRPVSSAESTLGSATIFRDKWLAQLLQTELLPRLEPPTLMEYLEARRRPSAPPPSSLTALVDPESAAAEPAPLSSGSSLRRYFKWRASVRQAGGGALTKEVDKLRNPNNLFILSLNRVKELSRRQLKIEHKIWLKEKRDRALKRIQQAARALYSARFVLRPKMVNYVNINLLEHRCNENPSAVVFVQHVVRMFCFRRRAMKLFPQRRKNDCAIGRCQPILDALNERLDGALRSAPEAAQLSHSGFDDDDGSGNARDRLMRRLKLRHEQQLEAQVLSREVPTTTVHRFTDILCDSCIQRLELSEDLLSYQRLQQLKENNRQDGSSADGSGSATGGPDAAGEDEEAMKNDAKEDAYRIGAKELKRRQKERETQRRVAVVQAFMRSRLSEKRKDFRMSKYLNNISRVKDRLRRVVFLQHRTRFWLHYRRKQCHAAEEKVEPLTMSASYEGKCANGCGPILTSMRERISHLLYQESLRAGAKDESKVSTGATTTPGASTDQVQQSMLALSTSLAQSTADQDVEDFFANVKRRVQTRYVNVCRSHCVMCREVYIPLILKWLEKERRAALFLQVLSRWRRYWRGMREHMLSRPVRVVGATAARRLTIGHKCTKCGNMLTALAERCFGDPVIQPQQVARYAQYACRYRAGCQDYLRHVTTWLSDAQDALTLISLRWRWLLYKKQRLLATHELYLQSFAPAVDHQEDHDAAASQEDAEAGDYVLHDVRRRPSLTSDLLKKHKNRGGAQLPNPMVLLPTQTLKTLLHPQTPGMCPECYPVLAALHQQLHFLPVGVSQMSEERVNAYLEVLCVDCVETLALTVGRYLRDCSLLLFLRDRYRWILLFRRIQSQNRKLGVGIPNIKKPVNEVQGDAEEGEGSPQECGRATIYLRPVPNYIVKQQRTIGDDDDSGDGHEGECCRCYPILQLFSERVERNVYRATAAHSSNAAIMESDLKPYHDVLCAACRRRGEHRMKCWRAHNDLRSQLTAVTRKGRMEAARSRPFLPIEQREENAARALQLAFRARCQLRPPLSQRYPSHVVAIIRWAQSAAVEVAGPCRRCLPIIEAFLTEFSGFLMPDPVVNEPPAEKGSKDADNEHGEEETDADVSTSQPLVTNRITGEGCTSPFQLPLVKAERVWKYANLLCCGHTFRDRPPAAEGETVSLPTAAQSLRCCRRTGGCRRVLFPPMRYAADTLRKIVFILQFMWFKLYRRKVVLEKLKRVQKLRGAKGQCLRCGPILDNLRERLNAVGGSPTQLAGSTRHFRAAVCSKCQVAFDIAIRGPSSPEE